MAIVTISRLLGSGGDEIAQSVAKRMCYNLVDSALIFSIAERAGVSVDEVENFDEKYHSRTVEWLKSLITPRISKIIIDEEKHLDPDSYLSCCREVFEGLVEQGRTVIVGRGGQFILEDDENVFHVRIIAGEPFRVEELQRQRGVSHDDALELIRKSDHTRSHFIERHFNRDWNDPAAYHLVIDSSKVGIDVAAEVIVESVWRFCRAHECIPGVKDGRGPDRRHGVRRKSERRDPSSLWTHRDMEHALLHDGRPVRMLNKPDRRKKDRRKGPRR